MAANNKTLLTKFAQLFNSNNYLATTKGLLLATRMMGFLEPRGGVNLPKEPAGMLNAINQRFEALLSDKRITDDHLLAYLMNFNAQDIMAMGPDLVADVMESPAYKLFKPSQRQNFERQANEVLGYMDIDHKQAENWNNVVLNEGSLRRMIDASSETQRAKKTAHGKIDNTLTAFDNAYRQVDTVALCNGPKHYGNVFTPQANLMGKLRANYVSILGEKAGNQIADTNEDLVNAQSTQGEKNAYLISVVAAHDETVMAIFKRRGIDAQKYNKAFLGAEIDGSDKENQHFIPNLIKTFCGAGKTFGIAAGASFTVNLLSNVPVIGNFIGPSLAIATAVKKAHTEYKQAAQIAAVQNRTLDRRDAARIAVNTAASVAPYAITMALGPVGRYIGAGSMMVKTFFADINQQKAKLRNTEKLSATDYLASAGKAILNGAALWLGGKVGSTLGSTVANNFDGQGFENDMRAKFGFKPKLQSLQTENFKPDNVITNDKDISLTAPEDKLTTSNITADQNSLKILQNHRFDLTDAARSTANPDTDRMYQMNHATGNYHQNDWYDSAQYQRAIDTLHDAGVQDADGALRNLAGARMFKGGEFKTELDNLLNGKLTTNTINKILEADSILDERADLIGRTAAPVQQHTNLAPERVTDFQIVDEPVVAPEPVFEPAPELVTDFDLPPVDPTFGPERMTDYSIDAEPTAPEPVYERVVEEIVPAPELVVEQQPIVEPAVEFDPTFGPERMQDYNIDGQPTVDDPTFGPERMTSYELNQDFGAQEYDAAESAVDTTAVEQLSDYGFDTGAANESSIWDFGRVTDYRLPNDWRDGSFDSMLDQSLNDITEKYK